MYKLLTTILLFNTLLLSSELRFDLPPIKDDIVMDNFDELDSNIENNSFDIIESNDLNIDDLELHHNMQFSTTNDSITNNIENNYDQIVGSIDDLNSTESNIASDNLDVIDQQQPSDLNVNMQFSTTNDSITNNIENNYDQIVGSIDDLNSTESSISSSGYKYGSTDSNTLLDYYSKKFKRESKAIDSNSSDLKKK